VRVKENQDARSLMKLGRGLCRGERETKFFQRKIRRSQDTGEKN
jgi:hypothetical protein